MRAENTRAVDTRAEDRRVELNVFINKELVMNNEHVTSHNLILTFITSTLVSYTSVCKWVSDTRADTEGPYLHKKQQSPHTCWLSLESCYCRKV